MKIFLKSKNSSKIDNGENGGKKKLSYPKSIFFIIGNEFCERFSFYGMRTILILYLRYVLLYEENFATKIYHLFVMACYFTPIFGAILSDSYLGKYWTILSISCLYAAGNIIIAGASISGTIWISLLGLIFIAIGTGGIKPCVSAFGGDQFQAGQERQLQQFFSLFYIAINSGSLISTYLTPILRNDVSCFGRSDCYPLAFGVPAILMVISLIIFIMGKFLTGYTINPPEKDNIVVRVICCISRAIYRRFFSSNTTKKEHWIDYADDKYNNKTRKDVKILLRILFLYIPLPVFWALFDQQASRWTLQAIRMNGKIFSNFYLKPDQIQVVNPLLAIIFVPVFDYVIYPIMKKIGFYSSLKKMVIGGLLTSLSFGACALLQLSIESEFPISMETNHNHLAIINNKMENITMFNQTINSNDIKIFDNIERSELQNLFKKNLTDDKTLVIYYYENDDNNTVNKSRSIFVWDNILVKPEIMGVKIFTLFDLNNLNKEKHKFSISGLKNDLNFDIMYEENNRKIGSLQSFQIDINEKDIEFKIGKNISGKYKKMEQGETYIQLIDGNINDEIIPKLYKIVDENKLSVLLQFIQYVLMTAGEILFSITGLEFSYSQAPKSMKSVLQASWLLTVAFGNLIVTLITEVKFKHQSYEFFFFSGLMFIDIIIFAIMAYFYVPYKVDDNDDDDDDIDDYSSSDNSNSNSDKQQSSDTSTISTENLSMKQIQSNNNNNNNN